MISSCDNRGTRLGNLVSMKKMGDWLTNKFCARTKNTSHRDAVCEIWYSWDCPARSRGQKSLDDRWILLGESCVHPAFREMKITFLKLWTKLWQSFWRDLKILKRSGIEGESRWHWRARNGTWKWSDDGNSNSKNSWMKKTETQRDVSSSEEKKDDRFRGISARTMLIITSEKSWRREKSNRHWTNCLTKEKKYNWRKCKTVYICTKRINQIPRRIYAKKTTFLNYVRWPIIH